MQQTLTLFRVETTFGKALWPDRHVGLMDDNRRAAGSGSMMETKLAMAQ